MAQPGQPETYDPDLISTAPPWSPTARLIWAVAFGVGVALFVLALRPVMALGGTALLLAYLLSPLVDAINRGVLGGRRRGLAAAFVLLLFLFIGAALLWSVVPALFEQVASAITGTLAVLERLYNEPVVIAGRGLRDSEGGPLILREVVERNFATGNLPAFLESLRDQLGYTAENLRAAVLGSLRLAQSITQNVFALAVGALLLVFIVFHLVADAQSIHDHVVRVAPDGYRADVARLLNDLGRTWNDFLRGQLLLGLVMGVAMYLLALGLGLPNPLVFAVIAGLLEFVPNIGPVLATVPPAATALFVTSTTIPALGGLPLALLVIVIWTVMQQVEALVLVPTIVGGSLDLHPVVVMLAVVWGASFGGVLGVIIAAPLVASLRIFAQYFYGRLTGRPSFRPLPQEKPSLAAQLRQLRRLWPAFHRRG